MKLIFQGKEIGTGGGSSEEVYSTEETRIGTWIDGKPLYQKTFSVTTPASSSTSASKIAPLPDGCTVISADGITFGTASISVMPTYVAPFFMDGYLLLQVSHSNYANCPCYVTIKYTKTTDIAGFSWWSPKMASDNVPSPYGAFASSDAPHYGSNGVYAAFDNDPDTFWSPVAEDTSNNYIGFDFGAKTLIKGIRILPRNLIPSQCPVSGTIEGSGDGTTWSEIEVFSNGAQVEGEYQTHMFDPVNYRYYRISHMQGTYKDGHYYVSIANIEIFKGGI